MQTPPSPWPLLTTLLLIAIPGIAAAQSLRVDPYVQYVTTSEAYVLWENGDLEAEAVQWGPDAGLGSEAGAAVVEEEIREAHLTGLQPDTRYHYEVGVGVGGVFRTPPDDPEAGFLFAAVSDMQQDGANPDKWSEMVHDGVLATVAEQYGPALEDELALVLVAGDLVASGWSQDQWRDEFLAPARDLMANVPFYPVLGNHEANTPYYFQYLRLPGNAPEDLPEQFWYFDRANVRFVGLDSNFPFDGELQLEWFEEVLDEACVDDDLDFVVSQLHHPWRSELWPPGESDFTGLVIEQLDAFTEECGKPAVHLFGHTHGYSRGQSRDHVHLWVNVASAGGNLDYWGEYDQTDYPWFVISRDEYSFVLFEVTAGGDPALQMRTYSRGDEEEGLDNVVGDEVQIRRYNHAPAAPEARAPLAGDAVAPECVVLVASPYCDPDEDLHGASQWQLAADCEGFGEPLQDRWLQHQNWYGEEDTQAGDHLGDELFTGLSPETAYCWRVRHRDRGLVWGPWSQPQAFTTGPESLSGNLLTNPGGEDGTDGWEAVEGPLESLTDGECGGTTPYAGERYLAVGGVCSGEGYGEARQLVDVSAQAADIDAGDVVARLGGMLSDYDGDDHPQIQLAFLDGDGAELVRSELAGSLIPAWTAVSVSARLPAGTRQVAAVLTGTRYAGADNDSYFDDLELRTTAGGALDACLEPPPYPYDDEEVECEPPPEEEEPPVEDDPNEETGGCDCRVGGRGMPVSPASLGLVGCLVWCLRRRARGGTPCDSTSSSPR